jgi:hypothetical protein
MECGATAPLWIGLDPRRPWNYSAGRGALHMLFVSIAAAAAVKRTSRSRRRVSASWLMIWRMHRTCVWAECPNTAIYQGGVEWG